MKEVLYVHLFAQCANRSIVKVKTYLFIRSAKSPKK